MRIISLIQIPMLKMKAKKTVKKIKQVDLQ